MGFRRSVAFPRSSKMNSGASSSGISLPDWTNISTSFSRILLAELGISRPSSGGLKRRVSSFRGSKRPVTSNSAGRNMFSWCPSSHSLIQTSTTVSRPWKTNLTGTCASISGGKSKELRYHQSRSSIHRKSVSAVPAYGCGMRPAAIRLSCTPPGTKAGIHVAAGSGDTPIAVSVTSKFPRTDLVDCFCGNCHPSEWSIDHIWFHKL